MTGANLVFLTVDCCYSKLVVKKFLMWLISFFDVSSDRRGGKIDAGVEED